MRIVVTGATGNVGTSVVAALEDTAQVTSVVGVARRLPESPGAGKATYVAADVTQDDLRGVFAGASAVIHLAWAIQSSRYEPKMWRTNVLGTERVLQAAAAAKVGAVVHASSLGAYSAAPKDAAAVDESWPTHGIPTSAYSRQKAYVERMLDAFAAQQPRIRVVPIRPTLILKHGAASEMVRLFVNPVLPPAVVARLPVPDVPGMRFQLLHSHDAARAFVVAAIRPVRGPFNLAADPVLDGRGVARILGAAPLRMTPKVLRAAAAAAWRARLTPTDAGWVDLILGSPLLDCRRAREELDWEPVCTGEEALVDLRDGLREAAGMGTVPLAPAHQR